MSVSLNAPLLFLEGWETVTPVCVCVCLCVTAGKNLVLSDNVKLHYINIYLYIINRYHYSLSVKKLIYEKRVNRCAGNGARNGDAPTPLYVGVVRDATLRTNCAASPFSDNSSLWIAPRVHYRALYASFLQNSSIINVKLFHTRS